MSKRYNNKISVKAYMSMSRRAAQVRFQKKAIVITVILAILTAVLLGSGIKAFASSGRKDIPIYKYYTSIQVQPGDTLWDIAKENTVGSHVSISDYIDEVRELNHMTDSDIHSGQHIVVCYYSTEEK